MASIYGVMVECVKCGERRTWTAEQLRKIDGRPICGNCGGEVKQTGSFIAKVANPRRKKR
jgi:formylmethanofuran dehydrogenase subunit E